MGSFLGSPYRGNTESGRVDHRLQELLVLMLVKIGLCTPFEDIVFGAALSADKPVPLTVSLLALTSAALLKMKGCSSAVEALCGMRSARVRRLRQKYIRSLRATGGVGCLTGGMA